LNVAKFRNLADGEIGFCEGVNVLTGANAQGKTSVLEALYVAATSHSFRTSRSLEAIAHGASEALISAEIKQRAEDLGTALKCVLTPKGRSLLVDDKKPKTIENYVRICPVLVLQPNQSLPVDGPPARRKLIDRLVLWDPSNQGYLRALSDYRHALLQRREILRTRGPRGSDLDAFEDILASQSEQIWRCRQPGVAHFCAFFPEQIALLSGGSMTCEVRHRRRPESNDDLRTLLRERREVDARMQRTSIGAHLDDLEFRTPLGLASVNCSQGQLRILELAARFTERHWLEKHERSAILLLDDATGVLDAHHLAKLAELLVSHRGQVLLSTTEMHAAFARAADRLFVVDAGRVKIAH
jgi:DNA replication and repair protein RecF